MTWQQERDLVGSKMQFLGFFLEGVEFRLVALIVEWKKKEEKKKEKKTFIDLRNLHEKINIKITKKKKRKKTPKNCSVTRLKIWPGSFLF